MDLGDGEDTAIITQGIEYRLNIHRYISISEYIWFAQWKENYSWIDLMDLKCPLVHYWRKRLEYGINLHFCQIFTCYIIPRVFI